jgi:hypothetical protein
VSNVGQLLSAGHSANVHCHINHGFGRRHPYPRMVPLQWQAMVGVSLYLVRLFIIKIQATKKLSRHNLSAIQKRKLEKVDC